jgi:hypothetical protein
LAKGLLGEEDGIRPNISGRETVFNLGSTNLAKISHSFL